MAIRTELSLTLSDGPTAFTQVCQHLGESRIGVVAVSLDTGGRLRLVVDNPLRTIDVLSECGFTVRQRDVLFAQLSNAPGALAQMTGLVSDSGVHIEHAYAAWLAAPDTAAIVIGVDDAMKASAATGI